MRFKRNLRDMLRTVSGMVRKHSTKDGRYWREEKEDFDVSGLHAEPGNSQASVLITRSQKK